MVLAGFAALGLIALVVQQSSLGDLRRLEQDYVASRQVTACANQALVPLAFGETDDLDVVLDAIVAGSAIEMELVRERFDEGGQVFPFPPLRNAHRAVGEAIDDQTALYQAMVNDPENSADELEAFKKRYQRAERAIVSARRSLLVGQGEGWAKRGVCKTPAPETGTDR